MNDGGQNRTLQSIVVLLALTRTLSAQADATVDTRALLCGKRKPCSVEARYDAGKGPAGETLVIYKLKLGYWGERACKVHQTCNCQAYEYVAAIGEPGSPGSSVQKLLVTCNDGYGAAGRGDDDVLVKPNLFSHERIGGSAWAWEQGVDIQLVPLSRRSEWSHGFWTLAPDNDEMNTWDWQRFSGLVKWSIPICPSDRSTPESHEGFEPPVSSNGDRVVETHKYTYNPVPRVSVDSEFVTQAWRSADLTRCSTLVTSDAKRGFLNRGRAGRANDAVLHVLSTAEALYVQLHDDNFLLPGAAGINDQLEILIVDKLVGYMTHCYSTPAVARRYLIDIRKGEVHADLPAEIRLESSWVDDVLHLKFSTSFAEFAGIAVSYIDTDDGTTTERSIATADLRNGGPTAVGRPFLIAPEVATCALEDGALVPRFHASPSKPFIPE